MTTSELNSKTQVVGNFSGVEVTFMLGDCVRNELCIKVTNIQKLDEKAPGEIENVVCLSDKRLMLTSINTEDVRQFLRKNDSSEPTPGKNVSSPKKQPNANTKDFRSRDKRHHVMGR